jgi:hypothetical protein
MSLYIRWRSIGYLVVLPSLSLALFGCGSSTMGELTPCTVIEPPTGEARPSLTVTSTPSGAEVWVGPGTIESSLVGVDGAASSSRLLGHTPVTARLAPEDVSPDGELEYSVRYRSIRRDGRIANTPHIIEAGGSVRIHANLHTTLTEEIPSTELAPSLRPGHTTH